jgi:hypothetical protein
VTIQVLSAHNRAKANRLAHGTMNLVVVTQ